MNTIEPTREDIETVAAIARKLRNTSTESRITQAHRIVTSHQMGKVDGILIDMQTANCILMVYYGLTMTNRAKFLSLSIGRMIAVAVQLTSKGL